MTDQITVLTNIKDLAKQAMLPPYVAGSTQRNITSGIIAEMAARYLDEEEKVYLDRLQRTPDTDYMQFLATKIQAVLTSKLSEEPVFVGHTFTQEARGAYNNYVQTHTDQILLVSAALQYDLSLAPLQQTPTVMALTND